VTPGIASHSWRGWRHPEAAGCVRNVHLRELPELETKRRDKNAPRTFTLSPTARSCASRRLEQVDSTAASMPESKPCRTQTMDARFGQIQPRGGSAMCAALHFPRSEWQLVTHLFTQLQRLTLRICTRSREGPRAGGEQVKCAIKEYLYFLAFGVLMHSIPSAEALFSTAASQSTSKPPTSCF
jgi:hypothetical protein